jgi:hypothetical protein
MQSNEVLVLRWSGDTTNQDCRPAILLVRFLKEETLPNSPIWYSGFDSRVFQHLQVVVNRVADYGSFWGRYFVGNGGQFLDLLFRKE